MAYEQAQAELNQFIGAHRIATVEKMFVPNGDTSFWSVCVTYMDLANSIPAAGKRKIDYREVLDERSFAVFAKLRTLRKTMSDKEGVPAYALFTNEQLAAMVRGNVVSLQQLGAIDGIGKARLEKYGNAFLTVLRQEFSRMPDKGNRPCGVTHETGAYQPV